MLVAFAAETARRAGATAAAKLVRKRADLIVVNEVGVDKVFGADDQRGDRARRRRLAATSCAEQPKDDLADAVWDLVVARL